MFQAFSSIGASSRSLALNRLQHRLISSSSPLYLAAGEKEAGEKEAGEKATGKKVRSKRPAKGQLFRADRVLSNRGLGSRSECFDLLRQRRVYQKVKSEMKLVLGPSEKITMEASLWVDGKTEVPKPPPLLRIYHKPKWVLSVMNDKKGRKNLGDLDFFSKMHPVGRLDYDSSGLLLFSSDGALTQTLLHPSHGIQKEYVALVVGQPDEDELREKLAQGVSTSMGAFPADLLEVTHLPSEEVKPAIDDILNNLPPEYDLPRLEEKGFLFFKDAKELSELRLVVEEGKHRMVRRILANSGFPVVGLKRDRLGVILLGDLEEGHYRDITQQEEKWANNLLGQKK
jgi:23S rRNA pseudouridine2605 synthase